MSLGNYLFGTKFKQELKRDSLQLSEFVLADYELDFAKMNLKNHYITRRNFQVVIPSVIHAAGVASSLIMNEPIIYPIVGGLAEVVRHSEYKRLKEKGSNIIREIKERAEAGNEYAMFSTPMDY